MENNCEQNSFDNDMVIRVKAKKCQRYKAGPQLSHKVQSIDVEVNEDYTGECESIELNIQIKRKRMINADA